MNATEYRIFFMHYHFCAKLGLVWLNVLNGELTVEGVFVVLILRNEEVHFQRKHSSKMQKVRKQMLPNLFAWC